MTPSTALPMTMKEELTRAVAEVRGALPEGAHPTVGLILGSGLGGFAETMGGRVAIPFDRIPGIPPSTIAGHAGRLVFGRIGGRAGSGDLEVLAMQGRVHFYEGHDLARVAFPARVLIASGCQILILTNAAGGADPTLTPGEIVILSDHINLLGGSPLCGPNDDVLGPRFPDMSEAYDPALRALAKEAGRELGMTLREGIYAALPGPQYETPAEVRMARSLGADLVGMSTVPETIVAQHMGAKVLGLSCVTNLAAGLAAHKLSHDEVTKTAARVRGQFEQLLGRLLIKLAEKK
jgi:purine-nucleoside phosphorylase